MDSILSAVGVAVSVMAFLVGFSSIRLRGERDRALSRTDAAFEDLARASRTGTALRDEDVAAATAGLKEAETRDPIGRWTLLVMCVITAMLLLIGIAAGVRSGLVFELNPFAWNSESAGLVLLIVVNGILLLLGFTDYGWISRDIANRLEASPLSKATGAIRMLRANDLDGALSAANGLMAQLPSWPWVRAFRAHTLGVSGRTQEAIEEIQAARELEPENLWWQIAHAEFLVGASHNEEALLLLGEVDKSVAGRALVAGLKGAALYGLGRRSEAIQQFDLAIALEPGEAEHRLRRGRAIVDPAPIHHANEPTAALLEVVLDEGDRVAVQSVVRAGRRSLQAREMSQAIEDFSFALSRRNDEDTLFLRAHAFYLAGRDEAAEADLALALRMGAHRDEIHRRRAAALLAVGRTRECEEELTSAVNLNATAADFHNRAMLRLGTERYSLARDDFASVLMIDAGNSESRAHYAEALALLGQIDESEREFHISVQDSASLAHTYEVWLQTLVRTGRDSGIDDLVSRSLAVEMDIQSRARILAVCGSVYARLKMFSRAIECFDEAESLSPGSPFIAYRRSMCYLDMGKLELATASIEIAVNVPWQLQSAALSTRSWIRRTQNKHIEALADITEAIRLQPGQPRLLVSRGCLMMSKGETDRALADFDQALQIEPNDKSALYHRVGALAELGRMESARADLEAFISIESDEIKKLQAEDKYFEAGKNWTEVVRIRRRLVDLRPQNAHATWALAAAYVNMDSPAEAEVLFEVLRGREGSLEAKLSHAVAISMQGRSAEAQANFKETRADHGEEAERWMAGRLRRDLLPRYDVVMSDWHASSS